LGGGGALDLFASDTEGSGLQIFADEILTIAPMDHKSITVYPRELFKRNNG
jgi:hypothetical protein